MRTLDTRTIDAKHKETIEDALAVAAEVNRRNGMAHSLAYAAQCEAAIVACHNHFADFGVAIQYMADNGLPWPPPPEWTPGYPTSED